MFTNASEKRTAFIYRGEGQAKQATPCLYSFQYSFLLSDTDATSHIMHTTPKHAVRSYIRTRN
jgi:hypothetical protein